MGLEVYAKQNEEKQKAQRFQRYQEHWDKVMADTAWVNAITERARQALGNATVSFYILKPEDAANLGLPLGAKIYLCLQEDWEAYEQGETQYPPHLLAVDASWRIYNSSVWAVTFCPNCGEFTNREIYDVLLPADLTATEHKTSCPIYKPPLAYVAENALETAQAALEAGEVNEAGAWALIALAAAVMAKEV